MLKAIARVIPLHLSWITAIAVSSILCSGCGDAGGGDPPQRANKPSHLGDPEEPSVHDGKVLFFFEKGCPECEFIKSALLGDFLEQLGMPPDSVLYLDVSDPGVLKTLLDLEKRLGFDAKTLAPILIADGIPYCGVKAVQSVIQGIPASE